MGRPPCSRRCLGARVALVQEMVSLRISLNFPGCDLCQEEKLVVYSKIGSSQTTGGGGHPIRARGLKPYFSQGNTAIGILASRVGRPRTFASSLVTAIAITPLPARVLKSGIPPRSIIPSTVTITIMIRIWIRSRGLSTAPADAEPHASKAVQRAYTTSSIGDLIFARQ